MIITFIAPPAAGKGALSNLIYKKYGYPHISIGDLLRNVDDEEVRKQLNEGAFVDNKIVGKLLKNRISKNDCLKGFILDGFPRNLTQMDIYKDICNDSKLSNIIIVLDVPRETGEKRITGRRVCLKCGSVYNVNIDENMPKVEGVCDNCSGKLEQRSDDNLDTYKHRYEVYEKETKPIIDYLHSNVYHVDGTKSLDVVFENIDKIIKESI